MAKRSGREKRRMDTGTPKRVKSGVVGTPGDEVIEQQHQTGFVTVKTVALAHPLLQERHRHNSIDQTMKQHRHRHAPSKIFTVKI
jgi:hypothetical protein